jgi:hypothetical protein
VGASSTAIGNERVLWGFPATVSRHWLDALATLFLEQSFPAFVERTAMASLSLQQRPYRLYSLHHFIKLANFLSRQNLPSPGGWSVVAKTKKKFTDFVECESELAGPSNHSEPVKYSPVKPSLSADALGLGQDTDVFVIANRGSLQSNFSCYLGNRQ